MPNLQGKSGKLKQSSSGERVDVSECVAGYVVTVSGSVCPVALPGGGAYDRAGPIPSFFSHQPNKSFAIRVS